MKNNENYSSQNNEQQPHHEPHQDQSIKNPETQIGKDDVAKSFQGAEPLPESTRPRKDGPGGN